MKNGRVLGSASLVGAAFLWATAYISVKQLVADIPPSLLLACRFSLAAVILAVLFLPGYPGKGNLLYAKENPGWKKVNRAMLFAGVRMGIALFFEFFFFTVGIQYTSASKSSFIIASYIILLPVAYLVIRRKLPKRSDVLSAVICMAGLCLIMADNLHGMNLGDFLSLLCAVAYAVHVVYSAEYAKKYDTKLLNLIQIATSAVLSIVAALILGDFGGGITQIPVGALLYLAVICTIMPYFLCLIGMKYVSTTTSGILLSFESVFATILAVIMLHERLYWQLVVGGIIILGSFFLSEWFSTRKRVNVSIVHAFCDGTQGGNPAGVVLLTETNALSEKQMQAIAKKVNLSETAFVMVEKKDPKTAGNQKEIRIRYFTPVLEVPMCGHATVASFSLLRQREIIPDGAYTLIAGDGNHRVEVCADKVWIDMGTPVIEEIPDEQTVLDLCGAYELQSSDLCSQWKPQIVTAGIRDMHLIVKNHDVLMKARQHGDVVSQISKRLEVAGVHMSCISEGQDVIAYCSNFAPYYGIEEECATGTSNAGLAYLLYRSGVLETEKEYCFLQGEHMGCPSRIYGKIHANEDALCVWIGGDGVQKDVRDVRL